ncbi:MAG: hypothetical protein WCZ28_15790 [Burkholderiaceae bacterium]
MNFHGQLHADEPPGGDYVRYIESLVGDPPEDAERAAVELVQRLADRQPVPAPADRSAPAIASAAVPAAASASASASAPTVRRVPTLREGFSRVLVVIGALLIGLGLLAPEAISMMPGIILLVAGLAIGRKAGRRPARPRSAAT